MSIKILLADDHRLVRDGLNTMIEQQEYMTVVAEAENGRQAVSLARKLKPNIVIMDINMPDLNGIDATRQIRAESSDTKVIALSMHSYSNFVEGMIMAGVSGYLLKDCAFDELTNAIRIVSSNQTYLSPKIAGTVVKEYVNHLSINESVAAPVLTPREREVLQLIAEGRSTKKIASTLNVSAKTIESHRRQIMEKLNISSIAELTKYAIREGLTSLEV